MMIKLTVIILSMLSVFGSTNAPTKMENSSNNFDISKLSVDGRKAYNNLIKAERFETGHLGRGGGLSEYVKGFGVLLNEEKADDAFKSITRNGTSSAKLYGLSGIYFTDHEHFKNKVVEYKKNNEVIMKIDGCLLSERTFSDILVSKKKNVAIIKPTQTLEDFWKENNLSYEMDIANGGYPATFKYFTEKLKK